MDADSINANYIATDYTDFKKLNADSTGVNYISSGNANLNYRKEEKAQRAIKLVSVNVFFIMCI